jgi:uncharacterized protein YyaL (SSP411 family)
MSTEGGGVRRAWRDGVARVGGFLEDYAFLANAHLDLYESGFERRDLERATRLVEHILERFSAEDGGFYFTPADGERLIHRPRAPNDHAWPSGTSTTAFALVRLYALRGEDRYRARAEAVFRLYGGAAAKGPFGFSHLLAALDYARRGPLEIVFAGARAEAAPLVEAAHRAYHPARALAFAEDVPTGEGKGPEGGRPAAYVCRDRTCAAPVTTAEALAQALV